MDTKQEDVPPRKSYLQNQQQSPLLHLEDQQEKQQENLQQPPGNIQQSQQQSEVVLEDQGCDQQTKSPRVKSKQHHHLQQSTQQQSKKQLTDSEREYWQHKLPSGFQFYLERLAKGVIRHQPENILQFSAAYLQKLLVRRDEELWNLPTEPYFVKLLHKRIGSTPWQPHIRQVSPDPNVLLPLDTEISPDAVATGTQLPQDPEVTRESPDMVTASECLYGQKNFSGMEDLSSLEAGHHTTAPSATSDDSITSMDMPDDATIPPSGVPVSGKYTSACCSTKYPGSVDNEQPATRYIPVQVQKGVADSELGTDVSMSISNGNVAAGVMVESENGQSVDEMVRDNFELGYEQPDVNCYTDETLVNKQLELSSHTDGILNNDEVELSSHTDGILNNDEVELNSQTDEKLSNEQLKLNCHTEKELGNEQVRLNSCRDDVLDNEFTGLNTCRDDVLDNEQQMLSSCRDDILDNEHTGLNSCRDDVLDNEQAGLSSCRDDASALHEIILEDKLEADTKECKTTGRLGREVAVDMLGVEFAAADILDNEQTANTLGRELASAEILDNNCERAEILEVEITAAEIFGSEVTSTETHHNEFIKTDILDRELFATEKLCSTLSTTELLGSDLVPTEMLESEVITTDIFGHALVATEKIDRELTARENVGIEISTAEILDRELTARENVGIEISTAELLDRELTTRENVGNELSTTEILDRELTTRENVGNELSTAELLDRELTTRENVGNELSTTELLDRELTTRENVGNERSKAEILSRESTTQIPNRDLTSVEVLNEVLATEGMRDIQFTEREISDNEIIAEEMPGKELTSTTIFNRELHTTEILGKILTTDVHEAGKEGVVPETIEMTTSCQGNIGRYISSQSDAEGENSYIEMKMEESDPKQQPSVSSALSSGNSPNLQTCGKLGYSILRIDSQFSHETARCPEANGLNISEVVSNAGQTSSNCLVDNSEKHNSCDDKLLLRDSSLTGLPPATDLILTCFDSPSAFCPEGRITYGDKQVSAMTSQTTACSCCFHSSGREPGPSDVAANVDDVGKEPAIFLSDSGNCEMAVLSIVTENRTSQCTALGSLNSANNVNVGVEGDIVSAQNQEQPRIQVCNHEMLDIMPCHESHYEMSDDMAYQASHYKMSDAMTSKEIGNNITGRAPCHLLEGEVTKDKEPNGHNVLSAHYNVGCILGTDSVINEESKPGELERSQQSKHNVENDAMQELSHGVMQVPLEELNTAVVPSAGGRNSSTLPESSTDNEDSDTCDPISDIQNDERSLKLEHAASPKKGRESTLHADDVRSAAGTRMVGQGNEDSPEIRGRVCQPEAGDEVSGEVEMTAEIAGSKVHLLQFDCVNNLSTRLSPCLLKDMYDCSCVEDLSVEKDSLKGVTHEAYEPIDAGTRDETGFNNPFSADRKLGVQTCILSENCAQQNEDRKNLEEGQSEFIQDHAGDSSGGVSVLKGSNSCEQHQAMAQVVGVSDSIEQGLAIGLSASSDIAKIDASNTCQVSELQDANCLDTIEHSPPLNNSKKRRNCCVCTIHRNSSTFRLLQSHHGDHMYTTKHSPPMNTSEAQRIGCMFTTQHSRTGEPLDVIICPDKATHDGHLEADKQTQDCCHREGLGKIKMERALSLAETYMGELEKVAMNIENILQTSLTKTTQGPIDEEKVENSGTSCVTSSAVQCANVHARENESNADGSSVNDTAFELKALMVSSSFLDEVSHKIVDICEERADFGSRGEDSQAAVLEYRTGNVVFRIQRVQGSSFECESQLDVGTNCGSLLSLSGSSNGDSAPRVVSEGKDVHNSGRGETGEVVVSETRGMTAGDSASNHSIKGDNGNNNNSNTNGGLNHQGSVDNNCINNRNISNCKNYWSCYSECCLNKQIKFSTRNSVAVKTQHNYIRFNNDKDTNTRKEQNTEIFKSQNNRERENRPKECAGVYKCGHCYDCKIDNGINGTGISETKPAKQCDLVGGGLCGDGSGLILKRNLALQATSVPVRTINRTLHMAFGTLHTTGTILHTTNKLHNTNNNGNIISPEPRNFSLSIESSNIATTKKETGLVLGKKATHLTYGTNAPVDLLVIDGNKVYPVPREAITGHESMDTIVGSHAQAKTAGGGDTPKAISQNQNRQRSPRAWKEAVVAKSRTRTASASGNHTNPQSVLPLNQTPSKSRSKSAETVTNVEKLHEKQPSDKKVLGPQRTNTFLLDFIFPKSVLFQSEVPEDSGQQLRGASEVVGENKCKRSPRCYVQDRQKQEVERQHNQSVDGRCRSSGIATGRCGLVCPREREVDNFSVLDGKQDLKPQQQSRGERKMSESQTMNRSSQELRRSKDIGLCSDTLKDPGLQTNDAGGDGGGNRSSRSPKRHFQNKKESIKAPESKKVEGGLKKSGNVTCTKTISCPTKCEGDHPAAADKETDNEVEGMKTQQQSQKHNSTFGLQQPITGQPDLRHAKCTLPQRDALEDSDQQDKVANEVGSEKKRMGSPICYLQNKKKQLEQTSNRKQAVGSKSPVNAVCGNKPPCPSKPELDRSRVQAEQMPFVVHENSYRAMADRFILQDTKNHTSQKIPGLEFLDKNTTMPLKEEDLNGLSAPVPNRKDFPLRIRAVSKHGTNVEYLPTVTRRLTIESPAENLMVHSSYIRPNPRQPEHMRSFEVSSQRRRYYLGESDEFINTEGTRRLICETECFSSKDPTTKHLVVENGTSSVMHATVKVVPSSVKKRKKRFASLNAHRQDNQEPGIAADLVLDSRHHSPTWQESDNFRKVGKYVVIGKTTHMGSIERLLRNQDAKVNASDNNRNKSSNASHRTLVEGGEWVATPCTAPFSVTGRGDHHLLKINDRNNNNNNNHSSSSNNNNACICKNYAVNGTCSTEKFPNSTGCLEHYFTDIWCRTSLKPKTAVVRIRTSYTSTIVGMTGLIASIHNVGLMNEHKFFLIKTGLCTNTEFVNHAAGDDEPRLSDEKFTLGGRQQNSNNNGSVREKNFPGVDKNIAADGGQSVDLESHRTQEQSEQEKYDNVTNMMSPVKSGLCDDPRLPSKAPDGHLTLETQVDVRDITATSEAQTGESLHYTSLDLPARSTKEIDTGRASFFRPEASCSKQSCAEIWPHKDIETQVFTGGICPEIDIQVGYPRDATGCSSRNINAPTCEREQTKRKQSRSYECWTQTCATDITQSTKVQTDSSLALNLPFKQLSKPTSGAETSEYCQKYLSDCQVCYSSSTGQLQDSQIQVTPFDMQSAVQTQTGESMMLTEQFPPPQLKEVADEAEDCDEQWGPLSVQDMPPEHQSVYAEATRRRVMESDDAGEDIATTRRVVSSDVDGEDIAPDRPSPGILPSAERPKK